MLKPLHFLCLLFLLGSCNENPDCLAQREVSESLEACPDPEPIPVPDSAPGTGDSVPNDALTFETRVEFNNFEREDEEKVYKALEIIKKVVGGQKFRDRVLNYRYEGELRFVDNKGLTNAEIYQVLLEGKEDLLPEKDNEMDLELELYYSWKNTVGYTYPNTLRIWMNTKYFDPYTCSQVAGNIFHEWTHKLGFNHAVTYSESRDSSVPYALGYLIEELGKEYE